jgi:hypothetical protein
VKQSTSNRELAIKGEDIAPLASDQLAALSIEIAVSYCTFIERLLDVPLFSRGP